MFFSAVTSIDTSGIEAVCEIRKILMQKSLQVRSMWLQLLVQQKRFPRNFSLIDISVFVSFCLVCSCKSSCKRDGKTV